MNTKGYCYPKAIIRQAVYFKLRFTLSYRGVEEIMRSTSIIANYILNGFEDKVVLLL
ncbi:hypothetical protein BJQ96_03066 [Flavobacterium sp. PL0002]|nr:hypothetical protein [Flavobacterium sp. PL002]